MTMMHDQMGRDYLYVANKDLGLTVYDISDYGNPLGVDTLLSNVYLDSLDVMNVEQDGNYLFLSLGSTFTNGEKGGVAIVDVTNPTNVQLTDLKITTPESNGTGIIKVEGNYAYVGAMSQGVIMYDVTDKSNITFVGQFIPDITFPSSNNPNPDLYNARGMEVRNGIVYLCYDAGGLRILDCTNPSNPVELGAYANQTLYDPFNLPRAYNNIVLEDTLAYVAIDYCGLEVLNIADPENIELVGWWNPYGCPNNNWFSSPVHTNELYYNEDCKKLFVSTGKSDMMVLDMTNPLQPDSCGYFGGVSNSIGTWGVNGYMDQIYLSYICAVIPFSSNWTGVKLLNYEPCDVGLSEAEKMDWEVYPNPATTHVNIDGVEEMKDMKFNIYNVAGQLVLHGMINENVLAINELPNGMYSLQIMVDEGVSTKMFIVQR